MSVADLGFQLIPPSSHLAPYVRSYWHFRHDTRLLHVQEEYMHPRGGFGIAFNFGDQLCLDTEPITEPIFLDGATTISRRLGFRGHVEVMGVSFRVGGAYPFFGLPLAEIRNASSVIDELDRPALRRLHEQLYEAKSLVARVQLVEDWLWQRLTRGIQRDALIPVSLEMLRKSGGSLAIPTLAETLAIGQRQLERLYHRQVGMSPKQYAQLLRVETARLALKDMRLPSTTSLAAELGFYDQSHFIREFRAVIGMTPYRYMQRSRQTAAPK